MNNAEVLVKFKGDTSSLDKTTKLAKTSILDIAKGVSLGTLAVQGVTKAVSLFNQGLDGAIARSDTMRNFPKVMDNLGISAEDATEVVNDLSEKLRGLPTALDRASQSVQRLTTKTGDVKEAERIFLAVNNAILAGGASSEIQASAMEQLSQAFAKGKPDMVEWRSLLTAMPAQLKQVATAMGYTSVEALGAVVRSKDGAEEFTKMINMMVQMNETGVAGFKSFEEQARNATSGISTSVTNMKTAIVRGVANLLTSVNDATQQFGGISGILSIIGKNAETMFTKIGELFAIIFPKIVELFTYISNHKDELILIGTIIAGWKIASYVQKGVQAFQMMKVTLSLLRLEMGTTSTVSAILKYGLGGLKTAFSSLWAVIMANPITIIVGLIIGLIAGFVYLWTHCEVFKNFWINLWKNIKKGAEKVINWVSGALTSVGEFFSNLGETIMTGINAVGEFITNAITGIINFIMGIPQMLVNLLTMMWNILTQIPYYIGFIIGYILGSIYKFFRQDIPNAWQAFWQFIFTTINNAINFFKTLPEKIGKIIEDIGNWLSKAWQDFIAWLDMIWGEIKAFPGKVWDAIVSFFANLWTKTIEFFDKMRNGIIEFFVNAKDKIIEFKDNVIEWFKELPGKLYDIGKNMIEGLIKGVKDMKDWAVKQVNKVFNGVIDGAKSALGIHSPSKEFAILGHFSVLGYTEALDEMSGTIDKQIQDTFGLSPNLTNSASLHYSPNVVVNNDINVSQDPLGQMVSNIKSFSGGAKNDYSFGLGE